MLFGDHLRNSGGVADGMDLRSSQDANSSQVHFQPIVSDQAKSLIELQDLQNEVGALLEFREVVMEAFPQLRNRLRSSGSGSVIRGGWEPGIRIRRKLLVAPRNGDDSSSTNGFPRSRSNSRSKGSSAPLQDSGFCTQESKRSSSQEQAEDELLALLDLIHSKGATLRLQVESLQRDEGRRRSRSLSDVNLKDIDSEVRELRHEKELLLDRITEMEAENLAQLAHTNRLLAEMGALSSKKRELEERLRSVENLGRPAFSTSQNDLHSDLYVNSASSAFNGGFHLSAFTPLLASRLQPITPVKGDPLPPPEPPPPPDDNEPLFHTSKRKSPLSFNSPRRKSPLTLGTLDGLISNPRPKINCIRGLTPDKNKTAAILKEKNIVELQRHLITITHMHQVAEYKLERLNRYKTNLVQQMEKFREENEDLKFQVIMALFTVVLLSSPLIYLIFKPDFRNCIPS